MEHRRAQPTTGEDPRILRGCEVLPPMESGPRRADQLDAGSPDEREPKRKGTHQKAGDRFAVANAFADYGARMVDTTAQGCWWIIWRETKPDGLARVSFGRIADCIGRERRTAVRAVGRLVKAGLLTVVRRGGLHLGPSTYRAHGVPKRRKP